jgi:hypothetical protein
MLISSQVSLWMVRTTWEGFRSSANQFCFNASGFNALALAVATTINAGATLSMPISGCRRRNPPDP